MITTKLIYDRRGQAKQKKEGIVEVRVTIERKSFYISTGVHVGKKEWAAGRVVNRLDSNILNSRIIAIYEKVNECVNSSITQGVNVDIDHIRKSVMQYLEQSQDGPVFLDWVEEQIPMLNLSEGTRRHYRTLYRRLTEFNRILRFEDVTPEKITQFDLWLHSIDKSSLTDAAVYNYHKNLKALLHRAEIFGKISRNPYGFLKFKRGDKESVEYLTEEEMKAFEDLKVPEGSQMAIAHDLFVFQMFTGLSYSDMQAFDFSLYRKIDGSWRYNGERIKTGVAYVSHLLPPAVAVLEKYNFKIPKLDNADYNFQLKALGLMAGIKIPLHSHLARHTFATWMLRNGAKIENVSKMLGHTNIIQSMRYAKVLAQSVHDDYESAAEKLKK